MTDLLLIRHGQAGATPENYDELSPLGHQQARQLGHWLLSHQRDFTTLAVGRMRRQRETIEGICEVFAHAGRPLPAVEALPGLDEYSFVDMLQAFARDHPDHAELAAVRACPTDRRLWVALLRSTLTAWAQGSLVQVPESYAQFQQRTRAALTEIQVRLTQGPVLAVSSAGVMGQVAQQILGFDNATFIDINLSLHNTSVCEYRLTRAGLKLASLNGLPHLAAPELREMVTLV
jgi:broad specificity phosphatase PhoE